MLCGTGSSSADCSPPDHRRLREIAGALLDARADAAPVVRWQGGEVRRFGDRLLPVSDAGARGAGGRASSASWNWRLQSGLPLRSTRANSAGGRPAWRCRSRSAAVPAAVRFRRGGERLRARARQPAAQGSAAATRYRALAARASAAAVRPATHHRGGRPVARRRLPRAAARTHGAPRTLALAIFAIEAAAPICYPDRPSSLALL